jgi:hypothetical protein
VDHVIFLIIKLHQNHVFLIDKLQSCRPVVSVLVDLDHYDAWIIFAEQKDLDHPLWIV